jgi:sugar lactone lactonase YvrE
MKGILANLLSVALLGTCFTTPAAHADIIYAVTGSGIEEFNSGGGTGSVFAAGGWGWLAISPSGVLYATGPDNTIYSFDSHGNASLFASSGLNFPEGLAFDSGGNLYAANAGNNTIEQFNANGTGSVFAAASSGLYAPDGLAFDNGGNLYAANPGSNSVVRFETSGNGSVFASSGLANPQGLAFDGNGNLYVSNYGNDTIEKFNSSGQGSIFTSTNLVSFPLGLALDSSGNLYIANHGDADILKIDPEGDVSVFASGLGNAVSIAIEEVPEPSSFLLAALGGVSLVASLKRKRIPRRVNWGHI